MSTDASGHKYENIQKPERRGPLVTLAYLWAAVPLNFHGWDYLLSDDVLPEPHQTFICTLKVILTRDEWLINDCDNNRWRDSKFDLLHDPISLKSLSIVELRDFITYFFNLNETLDEKNLIDKMAKTGEIQKLLLLLAKLVEPNYFCELSYHD